MVQDTMASAQKFKFRVRPARIGETDKERTTAEYITEMVLELRNLAHGAELRTLSRLLEFAYYEAYSLANKVDFPPAEIERIRVLERAAKEMA